MLAAALVTLSPPGQAALVADWDPVGLAYYNSSPETPNDLSWQSQSTTFKAATTSTPLVLDAGTGSFITADAIIRSPFAFNATFDAFSLTQLPSDLYYLPESSLDDLITTSAYGEWQLEVLDNRAGAVITNANRLVDWRLEFVLANTNLAPAAFGTLLPGAQSHNTLVAGGGYYGYYTVPVPPAALFATNLLLSATLPVNVWFSTNFPPTVNGPGDVLLLAGVNGGSATLDTVTTTPVIVPGTTYYLVIQNTNSAPVSFDAKVNFDGVGNFTSLKFAAAKVSNGKPSLKWQTSPGMHYKVQWADTLPPVWHTINTPTVTTTNRVSTFTDTGAQTAPLGPQRFYRLLRVP